MKGVMRFGKKGKLSPQYIGSFEILERIGPLAYRMALPPTLTKVHDMFHISVLRKYVSDLSHVLSYEPLEIGDALSYEEVQQLRTKKIPLVKVLWRNHAVKEASWELEAEIHQKYP
ncbi:uncharacterized protein LOC131158563 [Malania oleifera]|uniref:uncharacterized protein LOC131158563 n=1 Tax=Malania oleifera TaxID=397392 RepID=UPI0025AEC6B5|nr:uncharacterized protein LOC131158563 [Malania oleifera]